MEKDSKPTSYAICNVCKRRMAPGHGCTVTHFKLDDQYHSRIKAGDADDYFPDMGEDSHCHDCNAGKGQYHHVGCDSERCPICRGQFFLCNCVPDGLSS